tara:strand:- start:3543 stop:4568 length:1026 start_codon:yes stop_codon:yes gene_type:complete
MDKKYNIIKNSESHGGDISSVKKIYKNIDKWIDLSSGINPNAYSALKFNAGVYKSLPSKDKLLELLYAAQKYYMIGKDCHIIPYSGAQGFIDILPLIINNKKSVQVLSPTYFEHYTTWKKMNYKVELIDKLENIDNFSSIIIIVNPNNPDGKMYEQSKVGRILENIDKQGGLLIIDESFMDSTPECGFRDNIQNRNVIIIRSFGKFFGLPGLRLGFLYGNSRYIREIEKSIGPWPISSSSIEIGIKALQDDKWILKTISELKSNSGKLSDLFSSLNIKIVGRTNYFILIEYDDAILLNNMLARKGIWTRSFSYNSKWLRIGLPRNALEFKYLSNTLVSIIG